jgi:hypothetical protein
MHINSQVNLPSLGSLRIIVKILFIALDLLLLDLMLKLRILKWDLIYDCERFILLLQEGLDLVLEIGRSRHFTDMVTIHCFEILGKLS